MWDRPPKLRKPGLFVTGTDTDVGKTVVSCAIAGALRDQQPWANLGVAKPMSTGCRRVREGLVNADTEALAHFANCRLPLATINPIRYRAPLAPAVAAEQSAHPPDWAHLGQCLEQVDQASDWMLIEGVGGLLVPIDPGDPRRTVLDLIGELGLPSLIVARAGLGTLNHTAMTARLLREADQPIAGVVINGHDPDASAGADLSMATNRQWIERMTGLSVLAVVPQTKPGDVRLDRGYLPPAILDAVGQTYWPDLCRRPFDAARG